MGRVLACNREACRQLLRPVAEVTGMSLFDIRDDEFNTQCWQATLTAVRRQHTYLTHTWHVRAQGQAWPVEELMHAVHWDGREYLLLTVRDMTRRAVMVEAAGDREPLLSFVLNESTDAMWDWDVARNQVFYSMPLKRILGFGPYEIQHTLQSWEETIHPDDKERVGQELDNYLHGRHDRYDLEYRLVRRDGSYLWIHDRDHVTERDADGRALRVVDMVKNIHARKLMEEQLLQMATVDELTGLLNRRAGQATFAQLLKQAEQEGDVCSVAMMDMDDFKAINDSYGHHAGDQVLRLAAGIFSSRLRASNVLVRWGGE